MSSGEHPAPPAVEPVPARLLDPTPQATAPSADQTAAKPASDAPATASTVTSPAPAAPTAPFAPATTSSPAVSPASPPSIGAPQLTAAAPPARPATAPPNTDGVLPAVPPESAAGADPKAPKTYGSVASPGRILVKATGFAWVQVYDGKEAILTRTLRPGDTYYAPDKPGLIMRTGNAGGLAFIVDGKELPALGPAGMVKKRIPLDPQRLISGDLGEEVSPGPAPAKPVVRAPPAAGPAAATPE
ncbi:DUF4115 domain-containing protein [Aliidongia sp.]|uniref:DUF4115 domain-containing protein n=1 Tax=Aliidongia sp. TaxID=1914230 RepID=UPI0039C88571